MEVIRTRYETCMMQGDTVLRLASWATEGEVAAVQGTLDDLGLQAMVEPTYDEAMGGLEDVPTIIQIVAFPLTPFIAGFFGKAGSDAWDGLTRFITELRSRRCGHQYVLRLTDSDKNVTLDIHDDDGEAINQLADVDLSKFAACYVFYSDVRGEWIRSGDGSVVD